MDIHPRCNMRKITKDRRSACLFCLQIDYKDGNLGQISMDVQKIAETTIESTPVLVTKITQIEILVNCQAG